MLKEEIMKAWRWLQEDEGLAFEAFYANISESAVCQSLQCMNNLSATFIANNLKKEQLNSLKTDLVKGIKEGQIGSFIATFHVSIAKEKIEFQIHGDINSDATFDLEILWWPHKVFGDNFKDDDFYKFNLILEYLGSLCHNFNTSKFYIGLEQSSTPRESKNSWVEISRSNP